MSRYIDADKVLKELHLNHKDVIYIDKNECAKRIEKIPTIDIVRCKECRHYQFKQKNSPYERHRCYCNRGAIMATNPDDFCSYGEREGE